MEERAMLQRLSVAQRLHPDCRFEGGLDQAIEA